MSTVANVMLWGTHVGTVSIDAPGFPAIFEYTDDFLKSGIELSPLAMPAKPGTYSFPALPGVSFKGLPGLLADSLPDRYGNALIDTWLASQGRNPSSFNSVERLCYTGARGMGALEYVPTLGPDANMEEELMLDKLVELASKVLTMREELIFDEDARAFDQILRVGTSAGGARAKALIAWNEAENVLRSGQIDAGEGYTYWLMKFDDVEGNRDKEQLDGPQHTRIEYAYYLMALEAGIEMTECRIYPDGDSAHFLTRRFDRVDGTGEKLHMQTLAALDHADFNAPGSYSYEQAARAMIMLGLGQDEIGQLYRRMVFNVMARNQDDHVKNISFLMDKLGKWSLAPAYDMTYAYNPGGIWTGSHQMTINGRREHIGLADLLDAAGSMNIKSSAAKGMIADVSSAVANWEEHADSARLSEHRMKQIESAFELQ